MYGVCFQIQNVIRFLKRCVVQRVYLKVQKQRLEEQKTKVPTELWAELAQKMAGVHEETISSAFSQVCDYRNVHVTILKEITDFSNVCDTVIFKEGIFFF